MSYRGTAIMGPARARPGQMEARTLRINPSAPRIAGLYLALGAKLGVRGDLAYAQALLETNYFRYGGLVRPEQNNYGGIGATGPGEPGASFATPGEGVVAHLQHLYAYATTAPLPAGITVVDPRFGLVERGSAPNAGDLNGRWAVPGATYGQSIDRILGEILMEPTSEEPYQISNAYLSPTSQNRPGPCSDAYCWEGVQGIVVHRTASPTMNARAIRNYFNDAPDGRFASSQFALDNAEILQLMPIGEVAYHTAGKNATHLGIETCEHNWGTGDWSETYRRLVWLTAYLARSYNLGIGSVSGHFQWDPVNRPYDPTHIGWTPQKGKATGLFVWEQFLADVEAAMAGAEPSPPPVPDYPRIPVAVRTAEQPWAFCVEGLLIGSQTYVPIRPYTACVAPGAAIQWNDQIQDVVVTLPAPAGQPGTVPHGGGAPPAGPPQPQPPTQPQPRLQTPALNNKLSHKEYIDRLRGDRS